MAWYEKYGYNGPVFIEDYFKKKKSESKVGFFSNFNKRWFMLDFKKATLSYSHGPNKKATCIIPFKDIIRVEAEIDKDKLRLTTSIKKLQLLHNQLKIYTVSKLYTLFAYDHNKKTKWATALQFIIRTHGQEVKKSSS